MRRCGRFGVLAIVAVGPLWLESLAAVAAFWHNAGVALACQKAAAAVPLLRGGAVF